MHFCIAEFSGLTWPYKVGWRTGNYGRSTYPLQAVTAEISHIDGFSLMVTFTINPEAWFRCLTTCGYAKVEVEELYFPRAFGRNRGRWNCRSVNFVDVLAMFQTEGVDDLKIQVPVPKSLKDKDEDEGSTQSQKVRKNSLFSTWNSRFIRSIFLGWVVFFTVKVSNPNWYLRFWDTIRCKMKSNLHFMRYEWCIWRVLRYCPWVMVWQSHSRPIQWSTKSKFCELKDAVRLCVFTFPESNIALGKWCLEDYFSSGKAYFQGC